MGKHLLLDGLCVSSTYKDGHKTHYASGRTPLSFIQDEQRKIVRDGVSVKYGPVGCGWRMGK